MIIYYMFFYFEHNKENNESFGKECPVSNFFAISQLQEREKKKSANKEEEKKSLFILYEKIMIFARRCVTQ